MDIYDYFLGFDYLADSVLLSESIFKESNKMKGRTMKRIKLSLPLKLHKEVLNPAFGGMKFLVIPLIIISLCGCAPLIIGGAVGAIGAYAVSKDTIQGDTDKPYDSLWDSAVFVVTSKGAIKQENKLKGYIELKDNSSQIYIRMLRLTRSTVRIRVSARKYHLPNLNLAQEIFTKIMDGA